MKNEHWLRRLAVATVVVSLPLSEAWILARLSRDHGWLLTAWLMVAALIGLVFLKEARFAVSSRALQRPFSLAPIIHSSRSVVAGLLFIFPGLLTDLLALGLLLAPRPAMAEPRR